MTEAGLKMPGQKGLSAWLGPIAIAAATAGLLLRTWLKWPDTLVDYGQQLYVAWRIAEGHVLYRDIAYFHGPLSSYIQAVAMRVWGTSLLALVFVNLLVLIGLIVLLHRLLASLSSRYAANLACLVFVTVFAFAQYLRIGNYNYICPYTSEITHGVVLALIAIALVIRFARRGEISALIGAGLMLGLVFLTKAEVFFAATVALGTAVAATAWRDRIGLGDRARVGGVHWIVHCAILIAAALLPPALAYAAFCLAMSPREAFRGVTAAYSALLGDGTSDLLFYRSRMGLDQPWVHLQRLATTTLWYLGMFLPALLVGLLGARTKIRPALVALAWLPVVYGIWHVESPAWFQAARPLPLLMMVLILVAARARPGAPGVLGSVFGESAPGVLTLAVFALALLAKIVLNSRVYHYGFVLAMPATVLLVLCLTHWIPVWIDRRGGRGGVFRWVATALLVVAMLAHFKASDRRLRGKDHLVAHGADAFWSDPRGQAVNDVLRYLESSARPDSTLLVVPDGIMLNYLARLPSPAPYLNYVPTEVFAFGEAAILESWRAHPADYVAVVEKSTAEFGYRYFGRDYGRGLLSWINDSYETVMIVGAEPLTGKGFGIRLMKSRGIDREARELMKR